MKTAVLKWRREWVGSAFSLACALSLAVLGTGCSKEEKEEAVAATPPAAETPPAEEQPAAEESTTDTIAGGAAPMNVDETLKGSDQAVQAKDWSRATDSLLKLQLSGSIQNEKQSWDYNRRMTVLQDELIKAADNGDPKAQAAIDLLRRSRRN